MRFNLTDKVQFRNTNADGNEKKSHYTTLRFSEGVDREKSKLKVVTAIK